MHNKVKSFLFTLILCSSVFHLKAFEPTYVAPFYYGPNALPVINMHSGLNSKNITLEVSASLFNGFFGDKSVTPNVRIVVPLFTQWVNLEAWYSVVDCYYIPQSAYSHFNLDPNEPPKGHTFGDVYMRTNIQILRSTMWKYLPEAVIRLGTKTASGGNAKAKRFADNPGYFIDLTLARSIYWKNKWAKYLTFAASIGFYCWQTDVQRQNDAYTYGVRAEFEAEYFHFLAEWSGYNGWEKAGDRPMTIKGKLGIPITKNIEPYMSYQYGIRDYPYHEVRFGFCYYIQIIK